MFRCQTGADTEGRGTKKRPPFARGRALGTPTTTTSHEFTAYYWAARRALRDFLCLIVATLRLIGEHGFHRRSRVQRRSPVEV